MGLMMADDGNEDSCIVKGIGFSSKREKKNGEEPQDQ